MTTRHLHSSLRLAALVLLATNAAFACAASRAPQQVTVHAEYYVLGGIAFDSLDALDTEVSARQPGAIELDACGPTAARALQAAIHRFNERRIDVRLLDSAAPTCTTPVARRVSQGAGPLPRGIDEAAVDRYWRQVAP